MRKVTIIMGAYNASQCISRAIESIINQTYTDWVLVICNDGSIDNTYEILKDFKNKYPEKIIVLDNVQNKGLSFSLNHCLRYVETEYVARMDADDISHIKRLETQVEFLDNNPNYDFIGTAIIKFDENGPYKICHKTEKPVAKDFLWNNPFVHPSIMIRTSTIKEVQGYRDIPMTKRCEDYDLWFRLYAKGFKGYNLQIPLLKYYEGKNSCPSRKYIYRINEAKVRFFGYKMLHLMPVGLIFTIKPFIVGIIPTKLLLIIKRNMSDKNDKK